MNRIHIVSYAIIILNGMYIHAALVSDDFNGYSSGANVANSSAPAVGEIWGRVGGWGSNYNMTATAPESPFTAAAGGKSATLRDTNSSSGGIGMGITAGFTSVADQGLRIAFDYYVESASLFSPTMILANSSGTGGLFLSLFNYNSTTEKYYISNVRNTGVNPGSSVIAEVALQTWYHVEITTSPASASTDTYTITVTPYDGTAVTVTGLYFRVGLTNFGRISFLENNDNTATGQISIDNVFVDVIPEPSAIGLLAFGMLSFISRRH